MILVDIPMSRGLPVIAGAALVKREGDSGWHSVHFDPVEELWVMLYEYETGQFVAHPNDDRLMSQLPDGTEWSRRAWTRWRIEAGADADRVGAVVKIETVPTEDASDINPWTVDGSTVTRATPVMDGMCGHVQYMEMDPEDQVEVAAVRVASR